MTPLVFLIGIVTGMGLAFAIGDCVLYGIVVFKYGSVWNFWPGSGYYEFWKHRKDI